MNTTENPKGKPEGAAEGLVRRDGSAGQEFFPCWNCGGFWIDVEKVKRSGKYRHANCPECGKESVISYRPHFLPNTEVSDRQGSL